MCSGSTYHNNPEEQGQNAPVQYSPPTWRDNLRRALQELLEQPKVKNAIPYDHLKDTPDRVVRAFEEYFSGLDQDPKKILERTFTPCGQSQMVLLTNIDFVSFCAHHLLPIIGKVHFGYIPLNHIAGLSKIPRLIDVLAKRPQVQEQFGNQLVDVFGECLAPRGCGVVVDALHMCMAVRGVKKFGVVTRTVALREMFLDETRVREEFLSSIPTQSLSL